MPSDTLLVSPATVTCSLEAADSHPDVDEQVLADRDGELVAHHRLEAAELRR